MKILLLSAVGTVAGGILVAEARAWMPYVSRWLLRRTVRRFPERLPEEVRGRWAEEVAADLDAYEDRPLGGLRFALGLYRKGGRALAAELSLRQALAHTPGPAAAAEAEGDPPPRRKVRTVYLGGPKIGLFPGRMNYVRYVTYEEAPADEDEETA